jgi:HEPN domain-containing protein
MKMKEQTTHWQNSAVRDWKTAQGLFEIKRYDACLFFCHLTLEKFLKGLVVFHARREAPYIHDLERLAVMANLPLSSDQISDLKAISAFNIAGRYSDYKFEFYKKCTSTYTQNYLAKTKALIRCLKKKYPKR